MNQIKETEYTSDSPFVYIFDLDDTLRVATELYDEARESFVSRVTEDFRLQMSEDEIHDVINDYHSDKVERKGNHEKEGFPRTLEELYRKFADETDHVCGGRDIDHGAAKSFRDGWKVVDMNAEDYAEQGFIGEELEIGAEDVLEYLSTQENTELHLLTAGPESVQRPKIEGLKLYNYFEEENIHLVKRDKQAKMSEIARSNGSKNTGMIGNSLTSDMKPAQRTDLGLLAHFNFRDWEEEHFDTEVDTEASEYRRLDEISELIDIHNQLID